MTSLILSTISVLILSSLTLFQSEVYICKGVLSKVYHKSDNCRWLKFCSSKIEIVSEDEAI